MKDEQRRFLSVLGQLPARLTAEQTAWVPGCQSHDIPGVVVSRLHKPLGNPPANGVKFFAAPEVLELVKRRAWLARLTSAINQHWRRQNARKKSRSGDGSQDGLSAVIELPAGTVASR